MHLTYLLINLFSAFVPFLFSFYPGIRFDKHFSAFFVSNLITAVCFIAWDVVFTSLKVWGFNERYTLGFNVINLPCEEVLFFICIPFACIFTYHCLNTFYSISWPSRLEKAVVLVLSIGLLIFGIAQYYRVYTAVSFLSTGILLFSLLFVFKVKWLPGFLSIYPLLLVPFLIVNGLLTGTGLQQPIVWYNNTENTTIRLLTIPLEDFIYAFELILLNLFFYERFKQIFDRSA